MVAARNETSDAATIALLAASLASESTVVLRLWLLPVLLGQPVLRMWLLAEHWGCPFTADLWVATRTTLTTRLFRLLAWNMPFHAEHHVHPSVPFHALPELARRAAVQRRVTSPGYFAFHCRDVPGLIARDGH